MCLCPDQAFPECVMSSCSSLSCFVVLIVFPSPSPGVPICNQPRCVLSRHYPLYKYSVFPFRSAADPVCAVCVSCLFVVYVFLCSNPGGNY